MHELKFDGPFLADTDCALECCLGRTSCVFTGMYSNYSTRGSKFTSKPVFLCSWVQGAANQFSTERTSSLLGRNA